MWKYFFPKVDCTRNPCGRDVPFHPLEAALLKTQRHFPKKLANNNWMLVIDFSQHSLNKRAYLINMLTGSSEAFYTSHGWRSDRNGWAYYFSNEHESYMSSTGLYTTGGTYHGQHGQSMYLHGHERTNSNAYARKIVIHPADYMNEKEMLDQGYGARSEGCPAFEPHIAPHIIGKLKGGSIVYIYAPPQAVNVD